MKATRTKPPLGQVWEQITNMLNDGVPSTWVAETFGYSNTSLRRKYNREYGCNVPSAKEFSKEWPEIRTSPDLYKLHVEFAPKGKV